MSAAPTLQDYFTAGKAEATTLRSDLTFDDGDISEFYMFAAAAMADHLTGYFAGRIRATFLDGATGDDLTTLADDHWNIQRNVAVAATGVLTFTRPNTSGGSGTIPAGTTVQTQADPTGVVQQFTTDINLVFGALDLVKTVNATAVVAGVDGDVAASTITTIVPNLFDSSITVSNAARFAGGADEESDDSLRNRVRQFPTTLRRGTLAALEYGATTVAGVAVAVADDSDDTGIVSLYVSDASGSSSPTMVSNVQTEIVNWRAAGVIVNVIGASLVTQNVQVHLTVRAGVNTDALVSLVQSAVTARLAKLKIGEVCSQAAIQQAVLNVDSNIINCTVVLPVADVQPAGNQIIRAGSVTVA